MNKFTALSTLSLAALFFAQCSPVSLDRLDWRNFSLYSSGLRDPRLTEDRPELKNAPVYLISLEVSDDRTTILARETIHVHELRDALDVVLLPNIVPNTLSVQTVTVDGEIADTRVSDDGLRMHIPLPPSPSQDRTVSISIPYTIRLPQSTAVGFGGLESSGDTITLGYFYPVIPVSGEWEHGKPASSGDLTANPVSFYLVQIGYPAQLDLTAPGTILSSTERAGRRTTLVAFGPARDLLLMLGKKVRTDSQSVGPVELRTVLPADTGPEADSILDTAGYALRLFERLFGEYPYRRLTFVEARFGAYGLEFPSTILLTSRLIDASRSRIDGVPRRVLLESTVVHEVAHQWFYALVGNDQITEPWIDEGFAQYATYRYYLDRYGPDAAAGFLRSIDARIERAGGKPLPIGKPVAAYSPKEYSAAIYGRAPRFLMTLEKLMGGRQFDEFLRRFVADYRWRSVGAAQLKGELERSCSCSLDEVWKAWVKGE